MRWNCTLNQDMVAIDLFCGVGGLTCGLLQSGLSVVAGYDIDGTCRYAYEKNNKGVIFYQKIVADITGLEILQRFGNGKFRVLVGCAPCQPFSKYTQKNKQMSEKWGLLHDFSIIIQESNPDVVSMENVPELIHHSVFQDFLDVLESKGYFFSDTKTQIVFCPDYGVPQMRRRLVVLASKLGPIEILPPTHSPKRYLTVRNALFKMRDLAAGEKDSKDTLHRCSRLSSLNLRRIRHSVPGGSWRDWPKKLVASCHRSSSGETYPSVYGRMEWDCPAPTITTQFFGYGNGRFGHPDQDRALSLREGAILQTFPIDYEFFESENDITFSGAGRMIGNAVPVRLGMVIGKTILQHINKFYRDKNGKTI
jgi:DNA (cytosine-5)-methyltransferase 1